MSVRHRSTLPFLYTQYSISQAYSTSRLGNQGLNIPNAIRILLNAPIATEEAHTAHTGDAFGEPFVLILVRLVHESMSLNIAIEVIADEVVVAMIDDGADESRELVLVAKGT